MSALRRLALPATMLAWGCAASTPTASPTAAIARAGSEGLRVLRYSIQAGAPEMEAITAAFAMRDWPDASRREAMARSGVQAAIVKAVDLDAVQRRLGPVSEIVRTELGTSPAWVNLIERSVPAGVAASVVPGWRSGDRDTAALAVRDWVVPDLEGGRLELEVAVHVMRADTRRNATAGLPPDGWVSSDASFACTLRDGEALLLLPRPPAPRGKGPATDSELPSPCAAFLLSEPDPDRPPASAAGFSTALVLVARMPQGIAPPPLDTPAPVGDTVTTFSP